MDIMSCHRVCEGAVVERVIRFTPLICEQAGSLVTRRVIVAYATYEDRKIDFASPVVSKLSFILVLAIKMRTHCRSNDEMTRHDQQKWILFFRYQVLNVGILVYESVRIYLAFLNP
jgi:hypothetical protein